MGTLKIGIAGARGLSTLAALRTTPGVEVRALCDLDEELLKAEAEKHGIRERYRVFDDMLGADLDAVVIATPMQCHFQQAAMALEAGMHVLSEVTAGVTMDELWWLIECVEKSGKVYMMAENYCYIPEVQIVSRMVEQGLFGEVYFGEGEYLHDIRHLTRYSYGPYTSGRTSWRQYWQLGKRGCFYPTHSLGPVMKWFGADHVRSVACFGTGWHSATDLRQEDTSLTLCQMESGRLIKLRVDCISPRPHNMAYYSLQGTKGCYEAPRGLGDGHKVWLTDMDESSEKAAWRPLERFAGLLPERYRTATEEQKAAGHWGGDCFVVLDFLDAVAGKTVPYVDVYDACEWTAVGLLSELSAMNGGRRFDMPRFRRNAGNADRVLRL